jgi:hypothetical protein
MTRHSIVIVIAACALAGCKGETVVKPDPKTQEDLDACKNNQAEKDKRIQALQDENAELMRKQGSGPDIVVAIEGNALTVRPYAGAPAAPPIDDKVAAAASKDFLNVVAKSRGAIQKCYEQALKKNTGLQAKTVTLTVSASFSNTGTYKDSAFAPSLGDTFDNCIKTVASHWALPTTSPAMTFKAQVSLTPS